MSASPVARQIWSHSQNIPSYKSVVINNSTEMPNNLSATPGGTLYSTTPGGSKIVYDRSFMLNLANSPLSHSPINNIPQCLIRGQPNIPIKKCLAGSPPKSASPQSTSPPSNNRNFWRYNKKTNNKKQSKSNQNHHHKSEEELFEMEMSS